ncbi:hypothetical protein VTO73DRAFT_1172 [Trametes versicolor]
MSVDITLATEPNVPPTLDTHPDFSSPNADVLLRSSDDVLFRVSSDLLCHASGWFATMFTLPQGSNADRVTEPIPMGEPSATLSALLSIVHGRSLPPLDQVDDLERLLASAEKYEVPMVISVVRLAFASRLIDIAPLRLYGIAYRMRWEAEAKDASSRTLTQDLLAPEAQAELAAMAPRHRDLLLDLHRRRREEFFDGLDDTTSFYANTRGGPCTGQIGDGDNLKPCSASLDHGHWWALKYALMRQWRHKPYDGQLDETFHYMPEVKDVTFAKCPQCGKTLYAMGATLVNINDIIRKLPRCVDWL